MQYFKTNKTTLTFEKQWDDRRWRQVLRAVLRVARDAGVALEGPDVFPADSLDQPRGRLVARVVVPCEQSVVVTHCAVAEACHTREIKRGELLKQYLFIIILLLSSQLICMQKQ